MKRSLGVWSLVAAIYFCVSGGAFGLEPVVALGPGIAVLLLIVIPIIWSAPAALMTAELSCAIPEEGGYYAWVKRALGQPWGFLCGWWSWISSWVDVAIYPTLFVAYLGRFLELIGYTTHFDQNPMLKWLVGLLLIIPLTLLNWRGVKWVGEGNIGFLCLLLVPFLLMVVYGMAHVLSAPGATIHPFTYPKDDSKSIFGLGLFTVMWNYLGWDSMSTVTGEVKDPQRTVTKALAITMPIVVISYLLPVLVGVTVLKDPKQWDDGAWVHVAAGIGGKWLAITMAAAGVVSSAGQFCSTLLAGSRIPFVMAEDRILPKWLTRIHPKFGTPGNAILISAIFYTAFSYESFKDLAVVDVVLYSSALLLEFVALGLLRVKEPGMPRPFRIPGGWLALSFVLIAPASLIAFACYSRIADKGMIAAWSSLIALATGPVVWLIGGRLTRTKPL